MFPAPIEQTLRGGILIANCTRIGDDAVTPSHVVACRVPDAQPAQKGQNTKLLRSNSTPPYFVERLTSLAFPIS